MKTIKICTPNPEKSTCFQSGAQGESLLRSALQAGVGFPYECHSGGCGSCRFELLSGEVQDLWPEAPGLSARDRSRQRYLACQCVALSDLEIRVSTADEYVPKVAPHRQTVRLIERLPLTHDLFELRFQADGTAEFLAGQYALLGLPAGLRAYSMSNTANAAGEWHFQVRHVPGGRGSSYLTQSVQPGDAIEIEGPYGLAYLRVDSPRDIVCVAGGSGLAPVISIARGASESGLLEERRLHFFYGGRTPRDICGEQHLRTLPGYGERIGYWPVVSDSSAGASGAAAWAGATGFVHDAVKAELGSVLKNYEFYFAGPPAMSQALQQMLMVEHQVPYDQVHFDRFF